VGAALEVQPHCSRDGGWVGLESQFGSTLDEPDGTAIAFEPPIALVQRTNREPFLARCLTESTVQTEKQALMG